MIRDLKADVPVQLRKDVLQGGRRRHAALHGEAQPVCLSLAMVRILSQDDGLHLVIRGVFQCVEDVIHVWIDTLMRIFIGEESPELLIIVFLEFICEQLIPFIADVYHVVFLLSLSVVFLFIIHENALEKTNRVDISSAQKIAFLDFPLFNQRGFYATIPFDKGLKQWRKQGNGNNTSW